MTAVGSWGLLVRAALPGPRTRRIPGSSRSRGPLAGTGLGIFAGSGIVAAVQCF